MNEMSDPTIDQSVEHRSVATEEPNMFILATARRIQDQVFELLDSFLPPNPLSTKRITTLYGYLTNPVTIPVVLREKIKQLIQREIFYTLSEAEANAWESAEKNQDAVFKKVLQKILDNYDNYELNRKALDKMHQ